MSNQAAIVGMGLVSAIGHDVETACASYRAGISRTSSIGVTTLDPETLEDVEAYGYQVCTLSRGFVGAGLYTRLGIAALNDLSHNANVDLHHPDFWRATKLLICVSPTRECADFTPDVNVEIIRNNICHYFSSAIPVENVEFCYESNAGVAKQFQLAMALMEGGGSINRAVILGVDSLVGSDDIRFFQAANRLHTDDVANGLIPGEAAAAIMIDHGVGMPIPLAAKAYVGNIHCDKESEPRFGEEDNHQQVTGRKLITVLRQSLAASVNASTCYVDLNGEEARAQDFGNAIPAIGKPEKPFPSNIQMPAEYFGDTGAASAAIAVCLAVRSFERNYHVGGDVVICSSSDTGETASMIVRPVTNEGGA
ncbi:hypothetical protein A9Q99_22060 [Gammaproteobacteria bacterium 45_16_T64]|nr:hypothetical protein A9Q99_22060 [Gammaproteobacteria bacterium 45_16_T64]